MSTPTTYLIRNTKKSLPGYSLAVIGSVLALAGAGVLAAFGFDGELGYGSHLLSTPATAVVSSVASIKHTDGVTTVFGQPKLRVSASPVQGTNGVFVGIGPAADVNRYLAGVATQQSTNLDLQAAASGAVRHNGRATDQPPTAQSFWVARASSTRTAEVNWKIRDGRYRVVVMSANGHGGFAATTSIGVTIPNIPDYALAALLLGLLIAGGGTALLIGANRQPRNGSSITDARSAVPASA
jgi:hypothetical protein